MPSTRVAYSEIQSWTPALSKKAVETGALFVLDGKNYLFDSKGPKSAFGSTIAHTKTINESGEIVESLRLNERVLLFTSGCCLENQINFINQADEWVSLCDFSESRTYRDSNHRWTKAYVGYTTYICSPTLGLFKVDTASLTAVTLNGVPENPLAICENNGRLIVLNQFTISYSAPFDGQNFSPEIGGAGFQVLAELVPGQPTALFSFEGGFYIFTDQDALVAEFVGGDVVYRFDRLNTNLIPISNAAWTEMNEGGAYFLSDVGFFRSLPTGGFQEVTKLFNEYFRAELTNADSDLKVRITYISEQDMLYVQLMDGTAYYNRTYVLRVSLDKWGIFSEPHAGIIRITAEANDIGYIDLTGRIRRFTHDSSSSEDIDGNQTALNSEITLGYVRPAGESKAADIDFELQEILVSAGLKATIDFSFVDMNVGFTWIDFGLGFYQIIDDWNGYGLEDFQEDFFNPGESTDWNLAGPQIDYNDFVVLDSFVDWNTPSFVEDWRLTPAGGVTTPDTLDLNTAGLDTDLNHTQACLNKFEYGIEVFSNLDGWENELRVTPSIAMQKPNTDLWTLFSHGHNHRIKFFANLLNNKFHIQTLAITAHYAGQTS